MYSIWLENARGGGAAPDSVLLRDCGLGMSRQRRGLSRGREGYAAYSAYGNPQLFATPGCTHLPSNVLIPRFRASLVCAAVFNP